MLRKSFLRPRNPQIIFTLSLFLLILLTGCGRPADLKTGSSKVSVKPSGKAEAKPSTPPEAHVFVDDAMLSKPYAILGGTVQNVGDAKLEKLSVELELRRRDDGSLVKREASVVPFDLAPGEKGKFSLKVLSNDWGSWHVLSLRSASRPQEVAFKSFPGAERRPERLPESVTTVVKAPQQKRSNSGEEFINTPDTPIKVP
jgi:hypothetical protein